MKHLLILLALYTNLTFAQGTYLDRSEKDFFFAGGFETEEDVFTGSVGIGYATNQRFDIGVRYDRTTTNLLGEEIKGNGFSPFLTIYVLKQGSGSPVTFSASTIVTWTALESDLLGDANLDVTGTTLTLEWILHHEVESGAARLIPHKVCAGSM